MIVLMCLFLLSPSNLNITCAYDKTTPKTIVITTTLLFIISVMLRFEGRNCFRHYYPFFVFLFCLAEYFFRSSSIFKAFLISSGVFSKVRDLCSGTSIFLLNNSVQATPRYNAFIQQELPLRESEIDYF